MFDHWHFKVSYRDFYMQCSLWYLHGDFKRIYIVYIYFNVRFFSVFILWWFRVCVGVRARLFHVNSQSDSHSYTHNIRIQWVFFLWFCFFSVNETAILIFDSSFYSGLFFSQWFLSHNPPVSTYALVMFVYIHQFEEEKKTTRRLPCMHVSIRFDVFKWEITLKSVEERLLAGARTTVPQWRIINDCIMFVGIVVNGRQHHARKLSRFVFFFCWTNRAINTVLTAIKSNISFLHENSWKILIQNLWIYDIIDFGRVLYFSFFHVEKTIDLIIFWLNTVDLQKKFCARMI